MKLYNQSTIQFCETCLSRDRALSRLGEFKTFFSQLCNLCPNDSDEILLCWECLAMLKKIKLFKNRVFEAQKIQSLGISFETLSSLRSVLQEVDNLELSKNLEPNDEKLQPLYFETTSVNFHHDIALKSESIKEESCFLNSDVKVEIESEVLDLDNNLDNITQEFDLESNITEEKNKNIGNPIEEVVVALDVPFKKKPDNIANIKIRKSSIGKKNGNKRESRKIHKFVSSKLNMSDTNKNNNDDGNPYQEVAIALNVIEKYPIQKVNVLDKKINNTSVVKNKDKKREPRKNYKFVPLKDNNRFIKDFSTQTKEINSNEVDVWRERKRNSEYFRKAMLKCETCVMAFVSEYKLELHHTKYHNLKLPEICTICSCRLPKLEMEAHTKEHFNKIICQCGFECYGDDHMNWHRRQQHGKQVLCLKCGLVFSTTLEFYEHYEVHSSFICDICGRRQITKEAIAKHIRTHTVECSKCNKKFKNYKTYAAHVNLIHNLSPNENTYCVLCDKTFKNIMRFRAHLYSSAAHKNERKPQNGSEHRRTCPECGKVFHSQTFMRGHYELVHLKRTSHYCEPCNKYYINGTKLRQHRQRKHLGVKPEKNKICSFCGYAFATNPELKNHMRKHTNERPYECNACGAKFKQSSTMKTHVKLVHENQRKNRKTSPTYTNTRIENS